MFWIPIKTTLADWKFLPQPQKLTELYFTNPNSLPTGYSIGQPQIISFMVHNLEYKTKDYRFNIIESDQGGNTIKTLASGSFILRQNDFKNETINVTPVDLGPRVKIEVSLENINESIDYWVMKKTNV